MRQIEFTPEENRVLYYIGSGLLEADDLQVFADLADFIGRELDLIGCSIWQQAGDVPGPGRLSFFQRQGEVILDYLPNLDFQVACRVIESGEMLVENNIGKIAGFKAGLMCPALIALPLMSGDKAAGALCLWVEPSGVAPVSLYLAREMARLLAAGLRRLKYNRPAGECQTDAEQEDTINGPFRPLPVIPGLSLAVRSLEIKGRGSDFYDFTVTKDHNLAIVLGSIISKSTSVVSWRQAVRLLCRMMAGKAVPPGVACTELSGLLYDELHRTGALLGTVLAGYHPLTRELVYSNAGYNAPVIFKGDLGRVLTPGISSEPFIGHSETVRYSEKSQRLNSGDIAVFYSNGVSELINGEGLLYTRERIGEIVRKYHYYNAASLLDCLILDMHRFLGGRRPLEPVTMAVLKVE